MKKTLYTLLMLAVAAVSFTSCSEDDDLNGSYTYYEPIMTWGLSEAEVRSQMSKTGDWKEDTSRDPEKEGIGFLNKKTKAEVNYHFDDDKKLESFTLYYFGCNKDFDKLKSDWAKALHLTWEIKSAYGMTYEEAKCADRKCDLIIQSSTQGDIEYMYVTGMYDRYIW